MFIKIDTLQLSHWSIEVLIQVGCTNNIFIGELVFLQLSLLKICELFSLGGSEKTFSILCYVWVFFAFLEEKRPNKSCVWDTGQDKAPPKKQNLGFSPLYMPKMPYISISDLLLLFCIELHLFYRTLYCCSIARFCKVNI